MNSWSLILIERGVQSCRRFVRLFPNSKVVCCVRHVPWIMDSLERLIRENAFELSGIFGFESLNTVYTRVNRLAMSEGLGGPALDARARI